MSKGLNPVYESVCAECVAKKDMIAKLYEYSYVRDVVVQNTCRSLEPRAHVKSCYSIVGRQKTFIFYAWNCSREWLR